MGIEKIVRLTMWISVVIFIVLFTVLIIIGYTNAFDFYYS